MGFKDGGKPHYLGHRERLRRRFRESGSEAIPDYELLELILFRAAQRRDTKPLAKALLARFGSFAEVMNAPEALLAELPAAITELKLVRAAAVRLMRGELFERPCCRHGRKCSITAARQWAWKARSSSASCSSTSATRS